MKRQSRMEIAVGIFVLVSLAATLVMVISIAERQHVFGSRYRLHASFENVAGLKEGAPVFLAGVGAGTVESLDIMSNGMVNVSLQIQGEFREKITYDSMATIGSVGLLGDKSIEITVGIRDSTPLQAESFIKTKPPVSITWLLESFDPVREKLQKILDDLGDITGVLSEDSGSIKKSLEGAASVLDAIRNGDGTVGMLFADDSLYRNLNQTALEGGNALATIGRAADEILPMFEDIRETALRIRDSSEDFPEITRSATRLLDSSASVVEKLESVAKDIQEAAAKIKEASRELPDTARSLRGTATGAEDVVEAAKGNWLLKGSFPGGNESAPLEVDRR